MRTAYPELLEADAYIKNIIKGEEEGFFRTLDTGLKVLEEALGELKAKDISEVPGDVIFKMYDTYGFPVDLIQDIVRDDGISLDMTGFDKAMDEQRLRSRAETTVFPKDWPYTELSSKGVKTDFAGHDLTSIDSEVLMVVRDGKAVEEGTAGDTLELVTPRTPFYGEAGGQVGDRGRITGKNFEMEVLDTAKDPNDIIIHKGKVLAGTISPDETVTLTVDRERRFAIERNHTATHILHAVLRQVLGDHVKQSGSLVAPDRLRFDFTHFSGLEDETLREIEILVNDRIRQNVTLQVEEMDAEEAFKAGATALFEEKYGDRVRLVAVEDFSRELCGGTHTERTGDIGLFTIISEGSVAAGVRRIEALTGKAAVSHVQETSQTLQTLAQMLKAKPTELIEKFQKALVKLKSLEKELAAAKGKSAAKTSDQLLSEVKTVNGVSVLAREVSADTPAALRDMADHLKAKIKSGIVVLGSEAAGKVLLVAIVTKDHLDQYHAGRIVKQVAGVVGGGGGGRPDMAQAGGSKPEKLSEALEKVFDIVAQG
jgi:alanyl-tRNA synthetase